MPPRPTTRDPRPADRYDVVALTSNDLVTDQRMQRCLTALTAAGYRCLLLGRERAASAPLDASLPFAQERHALAAQSGKRFYRELNRAHRARLLELRPRAVLVVDLDTMWAGARAARRLGVPWAYDAHELFTELPEVRSRWWIRAAWSALARRYVPRAAAVYTVGDEVSRELRERYGLGHVGVVRNLPAEPDADELAERPRRLRALRRRFPAAFAPLPGTHTQPYTIIYQGALNDGRGLEELLRAAAQLPAARFWIAGDGYRARDLYAEAGRLNLSNVFFLGALAPRDLRALTPRADLGYGLMRDLGLNYYLSLSNKCADYLQAGIPSLQMDWPEYRALAQRVDGLHLVERLDVDSVVAAIRGAQSGEPTRVRTEGLTWEAEARRLVAIWSRVLSPPA